MGIYKCPKCGMVYDKPGICEMDGTKLVEVMDHGEIAPQTKERHLHVHQHSEVLNDHHARANHQDHSAHHHSHHAEMMKDFKKRFIWSSIFTIPILILSPTIQELSGISISFPGDLYVLFLLSSFVFFWGGYPFIKGLADELKRKNPGMMTLIGMATTVAYAYSSLVVFGFKGKYFFWELSTLIDIMLLGHWIEMRATLGASRALEMLTKLLPKVAHLIVENGDIKDVEVEHLKKGDLILIKAGERVPADGVVVKGKSYVDESMLTGEAIPVEKNPGDVVIGGSINGDGVLEVRVMKTGKETYISKIIELVREAQRKKSKAERLADVAAKWLTFIALGSGISTLMFWSLRGADFAFALERMVTVMVIACPHALGLAVPLVSAVSTALAARQGLLIRNKVAFENARKLTTVVFDKTGTLTEGSFSVESIEILVDEYDEDEIIKIAASIERKSEHPIAKGIVNEAKKRGIKLVELEDFKVLKGEGVEGTIDGKRVKILSIKTVKGILEQLGIKEEGEIHTTVVLLVENIPIAIIKLADRIRKESYEAVRELKKKGLKCYMITGDSEKVAKKVADELELDGYFAEVLPDEKQRKVMELKDRGELVGMVGDGINDAPALAAADVGIAIGSGTDVAVETADIILVNSDPRGVVSLLDLSDITYRKMIQNLLWATGYNAIAIPLAAGIFGIFIPPAVGAIFMSISTVIVAVNARFLKLKR